MNSKEYWQKRGELTKAHLMQKADDFADDMEKAYKAASESIEKDISVFFQRFAKNEGITLAEANKLLKDGELEQFKMTVEEYIQKGIENSVSEKWLKELESASDLYRISRLKALQTQINNQVEMLAAYKEQGLSKTLQEIFEEGYYRNIFDFQQFTGVGSAFATLDTKAINAALSKPWTYDGETFSTRIWKDRDKLKYSLEKILTQGIIRGDSPDKTAKLISKETGTELSASRRLVLTESAAIAERASLESYKELGVDEIEILVTLDEKTCGTCGPLDGRHFPKSDAKAGVNIPPFHPWCRCTTVPYFNDEFTADEQRAARDKDGSTYYVPGNMTYEEWKKKYVDSAVDYPNFLSIKNQEKLNDDIEQRFNREVSLIPESHRNIIKSAINEVRLIDTGNSRYDRKKGILYLRTDFIEGELVHEIGHAIETKLDLYHNKEFLELVHKTVDSHNMADIIFDNDTFGEPVIYLKAKNLISIYQGRLYEEVGIFDDDMNINIFSFAEYFAEGYNAYIYNNVLLKEKDTELYNFIEKLGAAK